MTAHSTNGHTFAKITGINSSEGDFGITGYYTGSTTSTATNTGCTFSFSALVGHVSKIETTGTCLTEASVSSPTLGTNIEDESGNGHGAYCTHPLYNSLGNDGISFDSDATTIFTSSDYFACSSV